MENTLVVYVSRTGNCKYIAEKAAGLCGAQIVEVIDCVNREGKIGFIKAGASAAKGESSPIKYRQIDFTEIVNVIIVQPMWAFSICPPMRTWLIENKENITKCDIWLIVSYLGTNPVKVKKQFESEFAKEIKAFLLHCRKRFA